MVVSFLPEDKCYAGVNTSDNGVYVFGGPWGNVNPTYIDSLSNLLLAANNGKLTDVISIATSLSRNFVLKADGTVWGWGLNTFGAIGDGTNEDRSTPVKVVGMTNITSVVSGANTTIALKNDGTVWAWGSNFQGDHGNGTADITEVQHTPIQISGLSDVIAIGENDTFSHSGFYAIKQDGTLWTWGCQANKIIDHSLTCPILESPHLPTQISGLSDVIDFKSRPGAGRDSYFVLKSDRTVWTWGGNFSGQLGNGTNSDTILPHGTTGTDRDTPEQVIGLTSVKEISVVETMNGLSMIVFALKEDGTVWAWGDNSGKQLGTGMTTTTVDKPTQVSGLTGITKIAMNTFHRLALRNDGTVWAWGDNNTFGVIGVGTGTTSDRITPIPIPVQLISLTDIVDIKANSFLSHALKRDGTLWGWGNGLLKNGATAVHFSPTQMCTLPGITNIFSSQLGFAPYLLKNDGTVWNGYFDVCTQL